MGSRFLPLVAFFIIFPCMNGTTGRSLNAASSSVQCIESEREALLRFKQGFTNPSTGLFSSWVVEQEEDCCRWSGVGCNNSTGHVITLDVSSSPDQTQVFQRDQLSSLLDLPSLSYLDLSQNDFCQIQIPQFLGSLISLKHLNLSNTNLRGTIPDHLGNLSCLQSLDLSGSSSSLNANNLHWLHTLSSLKFLDLGRVDLSGAVDWLDSINMLPSLVELRLFACRLKNLIQPSLPYVNFTSLEILDLSLNSFNSTLPRWLFNVSQSLVYLNISRSQLQGLIPNAFENMTSLEVLDLSRNNLEGGIPASLGLIQAEKQDKRLSGLRQLHLSRNRLNGSLEQSSLSQLSELVVLDVASNSFEGAISETQLLNFSSLRVLDLSLNFLTFNVSLSWIPPFQLHTIRLQSCQLGPRFPEWLRTQKDFLSLDISDAGISDMVPLWFWNLSNKVQYMSLSRNQLGGKVPNFSLKANLSKLDLSFNNFDGPLPHFSPSMVSLILTRNSFSGSISSICEMLVPNNSLSYLDLSANVLSGEIPDCWTYGQKLSYLWLSDNNLSGKIPNSIGHLVHLNLLNLGHNSLSGGLQQSSLKNCTSLLFLDLYSNKFSGNIPAWIGEKLQNLLRLSLQANAFEGNIPLQLCQLKSLTILDLSSNNLSGSIPRCINNFLGMSKMESDHRYIYDPYTPTKNTLLFPFVVMENVPLKYFKSLDLSSNRLSGDIPREITSLRELGYLNLSGNHLGGNIPDGIGDMESLVFLDLSRNELSCSIPPSLSNLSCLSDLNLSHNRLSGKIPSGVRLKAFDASTYMENRNLCGPPLANLCLINADYEEDPECGNKDRNEANAGGTREDDDDETTSFYISMGIGFITAFVGLLGTLLMKSSWRNAYYKFLGNFYDKIYVLIAVNVNRLARKFQNNHVAR